jgi:Domain of unknown function (DUF1844)
MLKCKFRWRAKFCSAAANGKGARVADEKRDEVFKVVDRRMFSAEGILRPEAVEEERREQDRAARAPAPPTPPATPQPAASPAAPPPTPAAGVLLSDQQNDATTPQAQDQAQSPASSRSFQMIIDFLARNAAMMLGGMPDPQTGQPFLDLEGAREMIGMLDTLREKTRGNLAPEDDSVLLEVIGSLKLSYMEISKAAAEAMRKKAPARP